MAEASTSHTTEDSMRYLECPVCKEHVRDPRILQCGHTICLRPCLERIVGTKLKFCCPVCSTEQDVPSTGFQSILKNVVDVSQLSVMPNTKPSMPHIQRCPLCSEEVELRSCGHCDTIICMNCIIIHLLHHREQLRERVCDFVTQINQRRKDESELIEKLNQKAEKMKTEVDQAVNEAMELIVQKAESVKLQVESVFQDELAEITNKHTNSQIECDNLCQKYQELYDDVASESATILRSQLRDLSEMLASDQAKLPPEALSSQTELQHIHINVDLSILREALEKILVVNEPVVDPGPKVTLVVDPGPKVTLVLGLANPEPLQLQTPFALVIDDRNGDIIVTDAGNNRIQRFTCTGRLDFCFGAPGSNDDQFSRPSDILVNNRRQMIIADEENHRIKIHNRDGSLFRVFGENGTGTAQFNGPCGLGLDSNNWIHVCDYGNRRMQVFSEDGVFVFQYELPSRLKPYRICFTSDKQVIILAIGQRWNVFVLNSDYRCLRSWEVPGSSWGLEVIGNTHIVVSIVRSRILVIYDLKGNVINEFGGSDDIPHLERPRGLAADKYGNIFVACEKAVLQIKNILS